MSSLIRMCRLKSRPICPMIIHQRLVHATRIVNRKRSTSSHIWLERQRRDIFVKQAGNENFRCRSAFKLLQIQDKYSILHPGQTVVDCGAAPGSWCQVAVQAVNSTGRDEGKPKGQVIGVDIQHITPIEGAMVLPKCDFTLESNQQRVLQLLGGQKAQVIISDMAPAATGIKDHNHQVIVQMCFSVLRFAVRTLAEDGTLLCKLWQGGDQPKLENAMKTVFRSIKVVKPDASRNDSAEIFLLARGFTPPKVLNKK